MLQDLRFAWRGFRRRPLVASVGVLALGLGIGGASAMFSVIQAVVLNPLPFPEPDRLVRLWELTRDGDRFSFSTPNYLDLGAQVRSLGQVAAYGELGTHAVLAEGGEPERIAAIPVTASLPDVLGVRPALGRFFDESDNRPGAADRHALLSDALWRRRFGADPAVIGRVVRLDDRPFVVSGIMPHGFDFPGGADAWVPLAVDASSDRGNKELAVIGRIAPGASVARVTGELREFGARLAAAHPETNAGWSADAASFQEWIVAPRFREAAWVLFAAVGLLLLLACANVANLLVASAGTRKAEMRLRAALGAGRRRLVRQLLTESALLALGGTVLGVLLAFWAVDLVRVLGGGRIPRLDELRLGAAALAFACAAGAASCVAFGLVPALYGARIDLRSSLDDGFRYTTTGRRVRDALVVFEVALALVLLVSAGLLANSFTRLTRIDAGFDTGSTYAMPIDLPASRYPEGRVAPFVDALLERVRALPGVASAGSTSTNPFRESGYSNGVTPAERAAEAPPSGLVQAGWRSVTPGFFGTMRIPVLSGRSFAASDRDGAERVVIVSARLAERLWPRGNAVGKQIYWGETTGRTRTVVGVVGDIRDVQLDAMPPPMVYVPHAQVDLPSMTVVARSEAGGAIAPALREALRLLDPSLPAPPVYRIEESRAAGLTGQRFNLWLLGSFAAVALALAVTGVYAMLAHAVSERRREIAIRLALGASGQGVARLVLRSGLALTFAGVVLGLAGAFASTRALASLLYGIAPTDPLTFAGAAAALLTVAALACWLPARHASRVNPVAILRS